MSAPHVNCAIAYGDLATAAIISVASQALYSGDSLSVTFVQVGGMAVLANQITDIVHPRIMSMLKLEHSGPFQAKAMDAAIAAGAGFGLLFLASGSLSFESDVLIRSAMFGLASVGGRMVSDMYFQRAVDGGSVGASSQV